MQVKRKYQEAGYAAKFTNKRVCKQDAYSTQFRLATEPLARRPAKSPLGSDGIVASTDGVMIFSVSAFHSIDTAGVL